MSKIARSIGPVSAVLLMINLVVGGGMFINLVPLLNQVGYTSFLLYFAAGLLQLPIVITLASLARRHPQNGGLYVYAKSYLSPAMGFLAAWSYFVGKSVSVGLISHLFAQMCVHFIPALGMVPVLFLDAACIFSLALMNIMGMTIQGFAQRVFAAAKILPFVGVWYAVWWAGPVRVPSFEGLSFSTYAPLLPVALFAVVGYEVICTVAHLIRDPKKNIMPVVIAGFIGIVAIVSLFHFGVCLAVPDLGHYGFPLAEIAQRFGVYGLVPLAYFCVYLSMIGGAFSILNTNCWNLYTLAQDNHLPFRDVLMKRTAKDVPWVSLLCAACISLSAVAITGEQVSLQKMAVFGVLFSFLCAIIAAIRGRVEGSKSLVHLVISGIAFLSAAGTAVWVLVEIYNVGISLPYLLIYIAGILLAIHHSYKKGALS